MGDDARAAVKDALIREAIALGALFAVLWIAGPGRVLVPAWIARVRARIAGHDQHEAQVRAFASEVSRWDHEQAARSDSGPAASGPCGC